MPTAFIVAPIGAEGSEERLRSDQLLDYVVGPACAERGFEVVRADKIAAPGEITAQITDLLGQADLVIADLTGLNPNVMYELGVRQALRRPYVQMAAVGQKLPFDVYAFRTIFYELSLPGAKKAIDDVKAAIGAAMDGHVASPVDFTADGGSEGDPANRDAAMLQALLDSQGQLRRDLAEVKGAVGRLLQVTQAMANAKQQEMMMGMMQGVLQRGMDNPEGLMKLMELVKRFQKPDVE